MNEIPFFAHLERTSRKKKIVIYNLFSHFFFLFTIQNKVETKLLVVDFDFILFLSYKKTSQYYH